MLTDSEFKDFIEDSNKIINGDIEWQEDEDHSPSVEFRAQLHSNDGHTSYVKGSYNPLIWVRGRGFEGRARKLCMRCLPICLNNKTYSPVANANA